MTPAQRLNELDRSSTWFLDQLNKLLHDKKWVEDLKLLPEDELIEVIGNLDNVSFIPAPTKSHSSSDRSSTALIAWAHHFESASMYCRKSAVYGWFSQQRTKYLAHSRLILWRRSHMEDFVTSTNNPSAEKNSVSNRFGCPL